MGYKEFIYLDESIIKMHYHLFLWSLLCKRESLCNLDNSIDYFNAIRMHRMRLSNQIK